MEESVVRLPRHKRTKFHNEFTNYTSSPKNTIIAGHVNAEEKIFVNAIEYADVFALSKLLQDDKKYGSVTKDFEDLHALRMQVNSFISPCPDSQKLLQTSSTPSMVGKPANDDQYTKKDISLDVIDLEEPKETEKKEGIDIMSAITVDSDDEDGSLHLQNMLSGSECLPDSRGRLSSEIALRLIENRLTAGEGNSNHQLSHGQGKTKLNTTLGWKKLSSIQYEKVVLKKVAEKQAVPNLKNPSIEVVRGEREGETLASEVSMNKEIDVNISSCTSEDVNNFSPSIGGRNHNDTETSESIGDRNSQSIGGRNHNDTETSESDGLEDLWKDMSVAIECSKGAAPSNESSIVQEEEEEDEEECSHSFKLEDDLGLVCRVCGVIQRRIDTIFDYQWTKGTRTSKAYMLGSRNSNLDNLPDCSGPKFSEHFVTAADICIHPRHMKLMKLHQIEGFNFLVKNLLADNPGGCILAHAPGSGKTFMLISFIQSFLAQDPGARPLVVLPKGILATWRKEFQRWQIEDIPLYDFYSSKADNRWQQLELLKSWQENRSILFLGYKQFANIICEVSNNNVTAACQDILLKVPTILILDEGHTPRNDNTDMVDSLAKVRTPRKVVLSGTLFQNHVEEVFNILKLVRPNFMKTELSKGTIKRIWSRVHISGGRRPKKGNLDAFCNLVEETLRNDENYKRKTSVIQELRNMTRDVLHYYKGDFLDELPGLVDFTVFLNLGVKQKAVIRKLGKLDQFKRSSVEKAIYIHPQLMELKDTAYVDKDTSINAEKVDAIIDSIDVGHGVKAKFFLNLLAMAESSGEKTLVFSQYLLPLKFLERLIVQRKGWHPGKEVFVISGDSSPEEREWSMDQFNNSRDAKVLFGSIKACGEGISLVGASRILVLDVHLNPSVTRQAVGRAFRPGQEKKVYTYRLVAADSLEEEDHNTSFRKELISKMWFEWTEQHEHRKSELDAVDVGDSQDVFFENPVLREDIKALYIR